MMIRPNVLFSYNLTFDFSYPTVLSNYLEVRITCDTLKKGRR